jgi:hypothetical protein
MIAFFAIRVVYLGVPSLFRLRSSSSFVTASRHVGMAMPAARSFAFDRAQYLGRAAGSFTSLSVIGSMVAWLPI